MTDQQIQIAYSLNSSNSRLPIKFDPLFSYLFNHRKSFIYSSTIIPQSVTITHVDNQVRYYFSLPYLLKLLHSQDETIYQLCKEFYGLTDPSIKDCEYSPDFIIKIYFVHYKTLNRIHINTSFKESFKEDTNEIVKHTINFEEFITFYEDLPTVIAWKESLFNKEYFSI